MPRRPGHVAFRHQRVERQEEIQVDASNIPIGHPRHILFSFPQSRSNCHDPLQRSIRGRAGGRMTMLQAGCGSLRRRHSSRPIFLKPARSSTSMMCMSNSRRIGAHSWPRLLPPTNPRSLGVAYSPGNSSHWQTTSSLRSGFGPEEGRRHCHVWTPADQGLFFGVRLVVGAVVSSAFFRGELSSAGPDDVR